jgi:hypothetical protein
MASPVVWSGVSFTLESVRGSALPITTPFITKANPGEVTSTAHGLSNGDYVLILGSGMTQVDNRVFRVAGVAANTFQLEGEDTTLYDTASGGNAYEITLGTTISTVTDVSPSGGEINYADTTTIHQTVQTQAATTISPVAFSMTNLYDPSDTGLKAFKTFLLSRSKKCFMFSWPEGRRMLAYGQPSSIISPGGSAQNLVTTPSAITADNIPTSYST